MSTLKLRMLLTALTVAGAIISSSCATTACDPVPIPLPPEQPYPTIRASELECLSQDAYERLVRRDAMKSARIDTLTRLIEAARAR